MKTVKEWLPDFYQMSEGNTIRTLLGDIWECEVESIWHARSLVNSRIEPLVLWLRGFKYNTDEIIKRLVEADFKIPNL